MYVAVEAEEDTAADSDDGSMGGSRHDHSGGAAKKTVAPLEIKINKKKKKRCGSDVSLAQHFPVTFMT